MRLQPANMLERWLALLCVVFGLQSTWALPGGYTIKEDKRAPMQDIITWDNSSIFVRGDRIMVWTGSFHPWRLPVPFLWLDVFQKIKAMGYSATTFYTNWALLEGSEGTFRADGIFAFDEFFSAAQKAGLYLVARPGPYINAESYGGGFPGWLQNLPAILRTNSSEYLNATNLYMSSIGAIIAKAQITNGGPVILVQPENEYGGTADVMEYVENQLRTAGIVVPFINNDAYNDGKWAPGKPGGVDIYAVDDYPIGRSLVGQDGSLSLGFDCSEPTVWPIGSLQENLYNDHLWQSPSTPFSIMEFQGGSLDVWGGPGNPSCVELTNEEFVRVFYKNNFAQAIGFMGLYMTFGGTSWGSISWPGGYTSYDYAAAIAEDRTVSRAKYSETKVEANFIQASPSYLTAVPTNSTRGNGSYTDNSDLWVSATYNQEADTTFYILRHAAPASYATSNYSLTIPVSGNNVTIPQLSGQRGCLTLNGRDSKVHVTNYDVGGIQLIYSTAEIFTWKKYERYGETVLVVYGGEDEEHELAVAFAETPEILEGGQDLVTNTSGNATIINYTTNPSRTVLRFSNGLYIYLLDRESAYQLWVINLPSDPVSGNYTNVSLAESAAIVKAEYFLRTVQLDVPNSAVYLSGDINQTSCIEVIGGAPRNLSKLTFNGECVDFEQNGDTGVVTATVVYNQPNYTLPNLCDQDWKKIDSLPELGATYDDSLWAVCNHNYSDSIARNLTAPVSTFAGDYGYHVETSVYRGQFIATGQETTININTQGGTAYGHSLWINGTLVGSFYGTPSDDRATFGLPGDQMLFQNYTFPTSLKAGQAYTLIVVVDNTGLDENYAVEATWMQRPRGLLDWELSGHPKSDVQWKVAGNLGGSADYQDLVRGPLNEGGFWAERQGYHLPGAPIDQWESGTPMDGCTSAGVQFYATYFDLDMPWGYDTPLAVSFGNSTKGPFNFRSRFFVNGYQFGEYIHNIGPQQVFHVPEGIWNYHGSNYLALAVWAMENGGAQLPDLQLVAGTSVQWSYGSVDLSPMPAWTPRPMAGQ